ncbi:MAG TPA: hypothetical protein VN625_02460, partial [Desulfuromonadaceae bacterium]|nr:hypothetical protein [Desulfuromonadaceae bacterium]
VTNRDLRILMTSQPWVAVSLLKQESTGTYTNKAGEITSITRTTTTVNGKEQTTSVTNTPRTDEIMRWVSYTVADETIAWRYFCVFGQDNRLDNVHDERFDAVELDPKYFKSIKSVEREVEAQMKKDGTYGQFGSVHTFWRLKQEKLKAKGIPWRSPTELNPLTNYD